MLVREDYAFRGVIEESLDLLLVGFDGEVQVFDVNDEKGGQYDDNQGVKLKGGVQVLQHGGSGYDDRAKHRDAMRLFFEHLHWRSLGYKGRAARGRGNENSHAN